MKSLLIFLRSFFISPEMVVIGLALIAGNYGYAVLEKLITHINPDPKFINYLCLLPVIFNGLMFKEKSIIYPVEDDKKGLLQKWDRYNELKIGYYVAIIYSSMSSIAGIGVWGTIGFKNTHGFLITITAIILGVISYCSIFLASIKVKDIFREAIKE